MAFWIDERPPELRPSITTEDRTLSGVEEMGQRLETPGPLEELMRQSYTPQSLVPGPGLPPQRPVRPPVRPQPPPLTPPIQDRPPSPMPAKPPASRPAAQMPPQMPPRQQGVPEGVRSAAHRAGVFAQMGNLANVFRDRETNPMASEAAKQMVIQSYLAGRPQQMSPVQQLQYQELMNERDPNSEISKNTRAYLAEKGITGLENASYNDMMKDMRVRNLKQQDPKAMLELQKLAAETKLKSIKIEEKGREEERKQAIADTINASGKYQGTATTDMSLSQLEKIATEIGLEDIRYRKARAIGGKPGIYGAGGKGPSAVGVAKAKEITEDRFKYLSDAQQASVNEILASDMPSKEKERRLESYEKFSFEQESRAHADAQKVLREHIMAPQRNTVEIYTELQKLNKMIEGTGDIEGWGIATSTLRRVIGGEEAIQAATNDKKLIRLFKQINNVEQAFARAKSGAAIGKLEWDKFKTQIGSGIFSTDKQLRIGVSNLMDSIRRSVNNTWNSVDESVRYDPKYLNRLKMFGVRKPREFASEEDAWGAED